MLPHFVVFSLGHLFLENYQQKVCNLAESGVKKFKKSVNFYSVLHPIIWSKTSITANTTLIIYLTFICLEIMIRYINIFVGKEITNAFTNQSKSSIITVPWAFLILRSLLEMVTESVNMAKRKQCDKIEKDLTNRLQTEVFSKVHDMSVRWNIEKGFGEIQSLVGGSYALWRVIQICLDSVLSVCVSVIFSFIYISTRYSILTAIIVVSISTILSLPRHFFRKWSKQFRDKEVKAGEEAHSRSMDSLANFQTVKNFACEDVERERYRKLKEKQTNSSQEKQWWSDLFYWCMDSLTTIFSLGITLYGAHQLSNGQVSYGEYVLLTSLFYDLYYSTYRIYNVVLGIIYSCEQLDKTVALLNETPEITNKNNAKDIHINTGRIEFRNVTFSYNMKKDLSKTNTTVVDSSSPDDANHLKDATLNKIDGDSNKTKTKKEAALVDVSFTVEAGQCLALVGPTGSGKSTIAKLLTRMYDIDQGEILIDHEDISEVTMKSLRSSIGIVPQEVELFNDKIGHNIKYGCPHATEEEIIEAASKAEIHEKIIKLEDKYESKVGNKGLKLSGGERQRIGIARVFLKDPKIVILDEATSALDTITEKKIQGSLEKAYKGKTSVVIAHRLSTICNADQIIVLDQGKVVEKGSHKELLELGGMYTDMWNQQTEKGTKTEESVIDDTIRAP